MSDKDILVQERDKVKNDGSRIMRTRAEKIKGEEKC